MVTGMETERVLPTPEDDVVRLAGELLHIITTPIDLIQKERAGGIPEEELSAFSKGFFLRRVLEELEENVNCIE